MGIRYSGAITLPQGGFKVTKASTLPPIIFDGMNEVGNAAIEISTADAYSDFYTLHNAMKDSGNTNTGYGPNSWPHKVVHSNTGTYETILDAGVDRIFNIGNIQITTDPNDNGYATDDFEIFVSDDQTNWTSCGSYSSVDLSGTTRVDTVVLSGVGRYLKMTGTGVADYGSNYFRLYLNRIDNPWDIKIHG